MNGHDLQEYGLCSGSMQEIGYTPWGYVYNILFTGQFLNKFGVTTQLIYGYIIMILIVLIEQIVLYKILINKGIQKTYQILILAAIITGLPMMIQFKAGNIGMILPMLMLIQILLFPDKKYETLQIVLMTFALIKPQISALIMLVYLIYRPLKTLVSCLVIVGIPWIMCQILLKQNPVQVFLSSWGAGQNAYKSGTIHGFLNPFIRAGLLDRQIGTLITMTIQIIAVATFTLYLSNRVDRLRKGEYLKIYLPCQLQLVLSICWMYVNPMDYTIPFIQAILLIVSFKLVDYEVPYKLFISAIWLHVVTRNRCEVVEYYDTQIDTLPIGIYSDLFLMIAWILWLTAQVLTLKNIVNKIENTDNNKDSTLEDVKVNGTINIVLVMESIQLLIQSFGITLV